VGFGEIGLECYRKIQDFACENLLAFAMISGINPSNLEISKLARTSLNPRE